MAGWQSCPHDTPSGAVLQYFVTVALYHRILGPVNMRTHKNEFLGRARYQKHELAEANTAVVAGKGQVNMGKFNFRDLVAVMPWCLLVLFVSFNIKDIVSIFF